MPPICILCWFTSKIRESLIRLFLLIKLYEKILIFPEEFKNYYDYHAFILIYVNNSAFIVENLKAGRLIWYLIYKRFSSYIIRIFSILSSLNRCSEYHFHSNSHRSISLFYIIDFFKGKLIQRSNERRLKGCRSWLQGFECQLMLNGRGNNTGKRYT